MFADIWTNQSIRKNKISQFIQNVKTKFHGNLSNIC